ncbi:MAG: YggT family protein [Candidatus Riflebacteria bacterium]|nr:YggT family protein [Candidatus Riflebacteria bacterium]
MILLIIQLLRLFELLIVLRILLSWFVPRGDRRLLVITAPIDSFLRFFRVLIPMGNMALDLGPILALLLLQAIERVLIFL